MNPTPSILFDNQIFTWQTAGGISRLFTELYRCFSLPDSKINISLPFSFGNNIYAKNINKQKQFFPNIQFKGKNRIKNSFNKHWMISQLRFNKYDIFHPTYYDPYFVDYIGTTPFVLTVFDMIHEIFAKKYFSEDTITTKNKEFLAKRAKRIIAISESTKKDLINIFKINPEIIDVVYLGCSIRLCQYKHCPEGLHEKKYLLFVGNRDYYKNFIMFVRSVSPILKKYNDINVVCIGGGIFTQREKEYISSYKLENRFIQRFVMEENLANYYSHAIAFVYPSLYEGFGIPLLEAFASGCPVIASDIPVFHEVAGNAALYFNPEEEYAMREQIEKMLNSSTIQNACIEQGYLQINKYSWENTAKMTEEVYLRALNS